MSIYAVSLAIVLLDQFTKFLALKCLVPYESLAIIQGVFHFSLVKNPGIAFGLFGQGASLLMAVVVLCLIGLLVLTFQMRTSRRIQKVALAFILGGALGNFIDRIVHGHVIDFLDFRVWPVFNVADSFITTGVVLFLITSLGSKEVA